MPGEVTYSRLLAAEDGASAAELLAEVRPRERAPAGRPFVFVNMVATIDGRAQLRGQHRASSARRPTSRCCSSCGRSRTPC